MHHLLASGTTAVEITNSLTGKPAYYLDYQQDAAGPQELIVTISTSQPITFDRDGYQIVVDLGSDPAAARLAWGGPWVAAPAQGRARTLVLTIPAGTQWRPEQRIDLRLSGIKDQPAGTASFPIHAILPPPAPLQQTLYAVATLERWADRDLDDFALQVELLEQPDGSRSLSVGFGIVGQIMLALTAHGASHLRLKPAAAAAAAAAGAARITITAQAGERDALCPPADAGQVQAVIEDAGPGWMGDGSGPSHTEDARFTWGFAPAAEFIAPRNRAAPVTARLGLGNINLANVATKLPDLATIIVAWSGLPGYRSGYHTIVVQRIAAVPSITLKQDMLGTIDSDTPGALFAGDTGRATWTSHAVPKVQLTGADGFDSGPIDATTGSLTFTPALTDRSVKKTVVYTLHALDKDGNETATAQSQSIELKPFPAINFFTATPSVAPDPDKNVLITYSVTQDEQDLVRVIPVRIAERRLQDGAPVSARRHDPDAGDVTIRLSDTQYAVSPLRDATNLVARAYMLVVARRPDILGKFLDESASGPVSLAGTGDIRVLLLETHTPASQMAALLRGRAIEWKISYFFNHEGSVYPGESFWTVYPDGAEDSLSIYAELTMLSEHTNNNVTWTGSWSVDSDGRMVSLKFDPSVSNPPDAGSTRSTFTILDPIPPHSGAPGGEPLPSRLSFTDVKFVLDPHPPDYVVVALFAGRLTIR